MTASARRRRCYKLPHNGLDADVSELVGQMRSELLTHRLGADPTPVVSSLQHGKADIEKDGKADIEKNAKADRSRDP